MVYDIRQWVLARVKRAILDYGMIAPGDRVAVGMSGGKDSASLLYVLKLLQGFWPFGFELHAVFVDLGWPMEIDVLRRYCAQLEVPFYFQPTDIQEVVFQVRKEKNPCALCANLRRGALNNTARDLGCNKVALGHHLDDAIETFFMSLIYTGQFRTFSPVTLLSRSGLTMIRPLVYLTAGNVQTLARQENLPVLANLCPVSGTTKREEAKGLVAELVHRYPDFRERFLNALQTADLRNLWPERSTLPGKRN